MHQSGGVLQSLHQVGFERIFEKGSHSALHFQIPAVNRLACQIVSDENISQPFFQVGKVSSQAEDSHNLAGNGDLESILTGHAVGFSAQADYHMAQCPVVHIHAAFEEDTAGVNAQSVALLQMVVNHSAQKVVGCGDGMHITGKVKVNILHGDNLGVSAAGSSAFYAEYRSQGRLTQSDHCVFADAVHSLSQTYRGGGFALTSRSRVDGGYQNQLAIFAVFQTGENLLRQFSLVAAVRLQLLGQNTQTAGNLRDGQHMALLRNFNVCEHISSPFSSPWLYRSQMGRVLVFQYNRKGVCALWQNRCFYEIRKIFGKTCRVWCYPL